ncbi:MAG TPA: cysteine--tRNA ligase [Thermomicrobiales bacterium]|nr:cysteine--tRNA ligase [Thermomicrobiales bacterium]
MQTTPETHTSAPSTSPPLMIYNTMTRRKEPFETIEPGKVRMYVCGVTVYDDAHIGHGMSYIRFDMIRRYLEHLGYDVLHAQNFTDIDDKIINRAAAEGLDVDILVEDLIRDWLAEVQALGLLPAKVYPRATQEVPEIIALIEGLIQRGHAYEAGGDVYFRVRSFADYGKLSGRDIEELRSGARIEIDERKEDPLDFALWKAAKPGEPKWDSPWGEGRPGWHIECSAMCMDHLGGMVDIHGGGRDLIFPHHENEIAQSEAFLGEEPFARYWVHNGMLQLDGEKMSKSLGNVVKLRSLIERGRAVAFRLMVLQSHYRAPLNYTEEGLEAAHSGLQRLRAAAGLAASDGEARGELADLAESSHERFHAAILDDFDTPTAMAALFELARTINREAAAGGAPGLASARDTLIELAGTLGIDLLREEAATASSSDVEALMQILIDVRAELRKKKQFAIADMLRDRLQEKGFILEDTRTGTTWKREATA